MTLHCLHYLHHLHHTLWHTLIGTVSYWTNPIDVGWKTHFWFLWSQLRPTIERPVMQSATRGAKKQPCWAEWSATTSSWDCPKRKMALKPSRSKWVESFQVNELSFSIPFNPLTFHQSKKEHKQEIGKIFQEFIEGKSKRISDLGVYIMNKPTWMSFSRCFRECKTHNVIRAEKRKKGKNTRLSLQPNKMYFRELLGYG